MNATAGNGGDESSPNSSPIPGGLGYVSAIRLLDPSEHVNPVKTREMFAAIARCDFAIPEIDVDVSAVVVKVDDVVSATSILLNNFMGNSADLSTTCCSSDEIDVSASSDEVHTEPLGEDVLSAGRAVDNFCSTASCMSLKVPGSVGSCAGHSAVDLDAANMSGVTC